MVHHRIQKKNRKKLKPVDPFNRNAAAILKEKLKGKNMEPEDDEQPMTKKQLEIQQLAEVSMKPTFPHKNRSRNRVFEESAKAGFRVPRFVNEEQMVRRVCAVTSEEIKEQRMLAKYELAGRDQKEIDAEYKKMDEELERKKKLRAEHKANIKRKKEKLAGKKKDIAQVSAADKNDLSGWKDVGAGPIATTSAEEKEPEGVKKSRLSRKDKNKEKRKEQLLAEKGEMILNAKEVIPFGSRVDAPPDLASVGLSKAIPTINRPGIKSLLLKDMLGKEKKDGSAEKPNDRKSLKRAKEFDEERMRVIEAYRNLKKARRQAETPTVL